MSGIRAATRRWFLFTGNRLAVSAVILAGVFVTVVALSLVRPFDVQRLISETPAARRLFTALLRGAILLASIVVSINSIVLSQEISDVETQRERVEGSLAYRERIEELIDVDVSPTQPGDFLSAILAAIDAQTDELAALAKDADDEALGTAVERYVVAVDADVRRTRQTLGTAGSGTFDVLLAGLDYDYADQLTAARAIERRFERSGDADAANALSDLVDTLELFAVGREYFKSLYYERELARLSTQLLAVSLPVIVVTSYLVLSLGVDVVPVGSIAGVPILLLFVGAAYTLALAPFAVLTAYVFRLSAITIATLAAGPFVVRGSDWREYVGLERSDDPGGVEARRGTGDEG